MEDLFNLSIKLEEREKVLANAEAEVGSGIRRVFLLEGEAEKRENRLVVNIALRMMDRHHRTAQAGHGGEQSAAGLHPG